MNYKVILNLLGRVLIVMALLMCLPIAVAIYYGEQTLLAFIIPIAGMLCIGVPLSLLKAKDKSLYAKEGFVTVALVWILISVFGSIPFMISRTIPNFFDAFFETVSGFTTTGATILSLSNTEISMPKSVMFWRIFTHWIGGMGVLVFLIALLPSKGDIMHVYRAESPGPSSSKLVSKIKNTAMILYCIYLVLTVAMMLMLYLGGMNFYESMLTAFSTAGTGGFSAYGDSIMHYNSVYVETVVATYMMLFGVNFNVYYLILIGKLSKGIKSEEFLTYLAIIFLAVLTISINVLNVTGNFFTSLRQAYFQVTSIMSTTGFVSVNFDGWPALSKGIILFLTVIGASGGSTGGGMKVSRLIILTKSSAKDIRSNLRSRSVNCLMFEKEPLDRTVERNVRTYFILWVAIVVASSLILSLDSFGDFYTHFTSSLTCIGNVGPTINDSIGSMGNFAGYNGFSKIILSVVMLAGRLEILPMMILFTPRTWKRGK